MNRYMAPIGTRYERPWYETRTPTTYASFRGPSDRDAMRLQEHLLDNQNRRRDARARAAFDFVLWGTVAAAVLSAAYIVLPHVARG